MKIRYAVWHFEKVKRKKMTKITTGELEWSGEWDSAEHDEIRKLIHEANPGKAIMGYGPVEEWDTFKMQIARGKGISL